MSRVRIGTAGWSVPREAASRFPTEGSQLERYGAVFDAVEINTTFYRPHRPDTFARWSQSTPPDFKFSVKLARSVTHYARLEPAEDVLADAVQQARMLADKAGPLLIQLPPSLAFDHAVADDFFARLRRLWNGAAVCEPRHPSWFAEQPDALLTAHRIARVAADPPPHPHAAAPGGWRGLAYWRLHGSPRIYYSAYGSTILARLAAALQAHPAEQVWCIFDNTASGAAATDALDLQALLASRM